MVAVYDSDNAVDYKVGVLSAMMVVATAVTMAILVAAVIVIRPTMEMTQVMVAVN